MRGERSASTVTTGARFPRTARVRARSEFDRIFKHGRRVALPVLALHWLDAGAAMTDPTRCVATPPDDASAPVAPGHGSDATRERSSAAPDATPPTTAAGAQITDEPVAAGRSAGPAGPRLGLAVSRKVDRRAVGRNRIKRIVREAFREQRSQLADADYVIVARPGAAACDAPQLRAALFALLRRAGALPPALPPQAPPGTMPDPAPAERAPSAAR